MGVSISIVMGVPLYRWIVYFNEYPNLKWMMTRGTPMAMETPTWRLRSLGPPSSYPTTSIHWPWTHRLKKQMLESHQVFLNFYPLILDIPHPQNPGTISDPASELPAGQACAGLHHHFQSKKRLYSQTQGGEQRTSQLAKIGNESVREREREREPSSFGEK